MRSKVAAVLFALVPLFSTAQNATANATTTGLADLPTDGSIVAAYYSNWVSLTAVPLESIPYDKINLLYYFVAPVLETGAVDTTTLVSPTQGFDVVAAAARKGNPKIKVLLSIFGWSGSNFASAVMADAAKRTKLVTDLAALQTAHGIDGFDIDWEFPGGKNNSGAPCNTHDPANDVPNYLLFMKELREKLPQTILQVAVGAGKVWLDGEDQPAAQIKEFAAVLDFVLIMDYDVANPLANPAQLTSGPNSPLRSSGCAPDGKGWGAASLDDAYENWTKGGFKPSQLLAGMSGYGRRWDLTEKPDTSSIYFAGTLGLGDEIAQPGGELQATDNCVGSTKHAIGIWFYPSIVDQILPQSGWQRFYDNCTGTPTLINADNSSLITYEDPQSICEKKAYMKEKSFGGLGVFDFRGFDKEGTFLNALTGPNSDCGNAKFPGSNITVAGGSSGIGNSSESSGSSSSSASESAGSSKSESTGAAKSSGSSSAPASSSSGANFSSSHAEQVKWPVTLALLASGVMMWRFTRM